jgi:DNA-binding transcriptional ArsR family regulator
VFIRAGRCGVLAVPLPLYQVKAEFFRTLGHPVRIRILELLSERERPVHELLSLIDVEASSLSQQLAVLRLAGLVAQRREAGQVIYAMTLPQIADLLVVAREILTTKVGDLVDEVSRNPHAS